MAPQFQLLAIPAYAWLATDSCHGTETGALPARETCKSVELVKMSRWRSRLCWRGCKVFFHSRLFITRNTEPLCLLAACGMRVVKQATATQAILVIMYIHTHTHTEMLQL